MSRFICEFCRAELPSANTQHTIGDCAFFLRDELAAARQRIEELEQAQRWIPVNDRLPELNEYGWSDPVLLAYRVIGSMNRPGLQEVTRYFHQHIQGIDQGMQWEHGSNGTMDGYGYEPVAWRPLLEFPEQP